MKPVQEVFLETQFDDELAARQARDNRAAQLQAQGLLCTCEDLYTVDGYRVFLVVATEVDPEGSQVSSGTEGQSRPVKLSDAGNGNAPLKRQPLKPMIR